MLQGDHYVFTKDYLVDGSTRAAAIVAGGNRSGPASWKSEGRTLGELEAAAVSSQESVHPQDDVGPSS
jgi:hypothetical protein